MQIKLDINARLTPKGLTELQEGMQEELEGADPDATLATQIETAIRTTLRDFCEEAQEHGALEEFSVRLDLDLPELGLPSQVRVNHYEKFTPQA